MPREESKEIISELFPEEEKYLVVEKKEGEEGLEGIEGVEGIKAIEGALREVKTVKDGWGRAMVQPPTKPKVKITLPISRGQYQAGFRQPVANSIRWLVAWIKRITEMFPGRVVFRGARTPY